jgi:hypothetical protein
MTNIHTPNIQIHDQLRYPYHTNATTTSIPVTQKYMTNIDTPNTQIHDQPRYPNTQIHNQKR